MHLCIFIATCNAWAMDIGDKCFVMTARTSKVKYVYLAGIAKSSHH